MQLLTRVRCLGDSKGRKHQQVEIQFRQKLFDYFYDENEYFFKLSGLHFDWNKEFQYPATKTP